LTTSLSEYPRVSIGHVPLLTAIYMKQLRGT